MFSPELMCSVKACIPCVIHILIIVQVTWSCSLKRALGNSFPHLLWTGLPHWGYQGAHEWQNHVFVCSYELKILYVVLKQPVYLFGVKHDSFHCILVWHANEQGSDIEWNTSFLSNFSSLTLTTKSIAFVWHGLVYGILTTVVCAPKKNETVPFHQLRLGFPNQPLMKPSRMRGVKSSKNNRTMRTSN